MNTTRWALAHCTLSFLACVAHAQPDWHRASFLAGREYPSMVTDTARGRVVLFGGRTSDSPGVFADTWEWDGVTWSLRHSSTSPSARFGHAMAYDSARQRVVLFGGIAYGLVYLADTWEWDGVTWVARAPTSIPAVRGFHTMAYDSLRGRVVLFGGMDASSTRWNDTWEWDGNDWLKRLPSSSPPASPYSYRMTYDSRRGRTVMLGSNPPTIWEWDGASWSARGALGMSSVEGAAYDSARQRVLFTGLNQGTIPFAFDAWEWDGSFSSRRQTSNLGPLIRYAITPGLGSGQILVFGGYAFDAISPSHGFGLETWILDASNSWRVAAPLPAPPPRDRTALASDAGRNRVTAFSGSILGPANSLGSDTWEWDGAVWREASPALTPIARRGHAMIYDAARSLVTLFGGVTIGGFYADTWTWNGTSWRQGNPATSPPGRDLHAMAYDPIRSRAVLFGGENQNGYFGDTWEWDGATWTQRNPSASPTARIEHTMAFDPVRGRVIVYGGKSASGVMSDMWEWDGSNWSVIASNAGPGARRGHVMCTDPVRGRVIFWGGFDASNGNLADTWDWDGVQWTQLFPKLSPLRRFGAAIAFDPVGRRPLLYGGSAAGTYSDTWWFGDSVAPTITSLGAGCSGSNGALVLASGTPFLGNPSLLLDLLSARASAPCAFGIGAATQTLGLGGCTYYLDKPIVFLPATSSSMGFASTKIAIPVEPNLRGQLAWIQAFVVDPAGGFAGTAFSHALALGIGD